MIKKFSKRQLIDQCGFNADEAKIILDYQKKLPILSEDNETNSLCTNARDLFSQLNGNNSKTKFTEVARKAHSFRCGMDSAK